MKTYLLLRENHETGPHTLEELKALSLRNLDLIWEEGVSQHWDFVTEFAELKPFVGSNTQAPKKRVQIPNQQAETPLRSSVFVTLPQRLENRASTAVVRQDPSAHALRKEEIITHLEQPLGELKERHTDRKFHFQKHITRQNSAWILALFGMLIFGAYVMKSMIEDESANVVAAGLPIMPIQSFPEGAVAQKPADATYQNAISKDETPTPELNKTAVKKPLKWSELKKQVSVSNNKFKVGLFGGVDDLQLNVKNSSAQTLDKVNVQITYLKTNGEKVRTEEYSVYEVSPKSVKILVVPPSKRGVKVQYKITGVESKGEKLVTGEI